MLHNGRLQLVQDVTRLVNGVVLVGVNREVLGLVDGVNYGLTNWSIVDWFINNRLVTLDNWFIFDYCKYLIQLTKN